MYQRHIEVEYPSVMLNPFGSCMQVYGFQTLDEAENYDRVYAEDVCFD